MCVRACVCVSISIENVQTALTTLSYFNTSWRQGQQRGGQHNKSKVMHKM